MARQQYLSGVRIAIGDKYELRSDKHQYILVEFVEGVNPKTKAPSLTEDYSFHATIRQAVNEMIDKEVKGCDTLEEIKELLVTSGDFMTQRIEKVT